jgi:hypothetical protein
VVSFIAVVWETMPAGHGNAGFRPPTGVR